MRRRNLIVMAAILAVTFVVIVGMRLRLGQPEALVAVRRSQQVMGTLARLEAVGPASEEDRLRAAVGRAFDRLEEVNARMSTYLDDSLLSRVNREAYERAVPLDEWTWQVVQVAGRANELSGGAFDPTVGPLVEVWKQAGQENRLPTRERIDEALRRVGWSKLAFERRDGAVTVRFGEPGMRIDLGGVAKGWAVDLALEEIRRSGAVGGLVDVGGDLRVFGRPEDAEQWLVAVRSPFEQGLLMELGLNDAAVCTSGNYHRFSEIEGRRYSHILDPRTGQPVEAAASVTVIGPDAAMTDALATALSVMGADEGMRIVKGLPGYEALLVAGEPGKHRMMQTDGFAKYVAGQGQ